MAIGYTNKKDKWFVFLLYILVSFVSYSMIHIDSDKFVAQIVIQSKR